MGRDKVGGTSITLLLVNNILPLFQGTIIHITGEVPENQISLTLPESSRDRRHVRRDYRIL